MSDSSQNQKTYTEEEVREATLEYFDGDDLATNVWVTKYALKNEDGEFLEKTPDEMHHRLAGEFARIEQEYGGDRALDEEEIFNLLDNFDYIVPQGSPMYGIGNPTPISLSNCVVVDSPEDTMSSIIDTGKDLANLMKRRAGVGLDISTLRPEGEMVNNSAETTSGAFSFADFYSYITRMVGQSGRRGALMVTMDIRHPDVKQFITMKQDLSKVTGANVSVRITDEFMEAVENDEDFELRWPIDAEDPEVTNTVQAGEVWDLIVESAKECAEPGLIMWDNVKDELPADEYDEFQTISTNPCSEIPLSSYDSCRLISINLKNFVKDRFTEDAYFDFDHFEKAVRKGMRLNDDLVDLELEKLEQVMEMADTKDEEKLWQKLYDAAEQGRRTGLGTHGLADCLSNLQLRYDSDEGVEKVAQIYEVFRDASYRESVELAKERGSFPVFDWETERENDFLQRLPDDIKQGIKENGRRNISLLTCAPTGSVSICSQTSSGVEPVFRNAYTRRRKLSHDEQEKEADFVDDMGVRWEEYKVYHHNVREYMDMHPECESEEDLPDFFVTSDEIDWGRRVDVQSNQQAGIDHSISSCLVPNKHMVHTDEGLMYIGDLVSEDDLKEEGFYQPSEQRTTVNHKGDKVPIDEFYVNGEQQCLKVELERGEEIIGTPNHKVHVLNEEYEGEWCRLDELESDDLIVGRTKMECFGDSNKSIRSLLGDFSSSADGTNMKEVDIPRRMTSDLARILGYMVSDGSVNDNGISLSQIRNNVVDDLQDRIKNTFGLESNVCGDVRTESDLVSVQVNSRVLRDYMEYLGITRSAHTKTVPEVIFRRAGRDQTRQFLKGVTCDGYVSEGGVCVMTTTNHDLARELITILNQYGIQAGVFQNGTEGDMREFPHGQAYECRESWTVWCAKDEAAKFVDMIGFAEDRKTEEAKSEFKRSSRKQRHGVVPDHGLRKRVREDMLSNIRSTKLHDIFHSVTSSDKQGRDISRENLLFLSDLSDEVPDILTDETYKFSRVKSVEEYGVEETYDLHVKKGNSYLVNGHVSHNTINLPSDVSTDTVGRLYKRAWKKGLKGVTVYVDGSRSGVLVDEDEEGGESYDSLLEALKDQGATPEDAETTEEGVIVRDVDLPETFDNGQTHIMYADGNKYYLHMSYLPGDDQFPVALWVHSNKLEDKEYVSLNRAVRKVVKLCNEKGVDFDLVLEQHEKINDDPHHVRLGKMISMALRHNISMVDIIHALEGIEGDYVASTLTAVRKFLKQHVPDGTEVSDKECSSCGSESVVYEEGCYVCRSCGASKCG